MGFLRLQYYLIHAFVRSSPTARVGTYGLIFVFIVFILVSL